MRIAAACTQASESTGLGIAQTYRYDPLGQPESTETGAGAVYHYHHDTQGSRVDVTDSTGALHQRWAYDPYGTRTLDTVTDGAPASTPSYTGARYETTTGRFTRPELATRPLSTPGTRTAESWTPHSQLGSCTQSGTTTDQTYAGTDNTQRLKAGSTTFTNAAVGLTGQNVSGAATGFIREPSGTLVAMKSGGASQYYLTDAQNSVIGLVDPSGKRTATYSYGPYGETRANSGTDQPFHYTSGYLDPSGLYKMGARYYDPNLGRFTQPDPSGKENNAYLYAAGDPINRSDPSGLLSLGSIGDGLGIAGILYEGFTGGTGAAEKATAAMIADIGITGLCEAGAAAFTGPGAVPALPYCMAIGAAAGTYIGATCKS
ncbi:RHS repeat-associated core domain-containing protein [Streptomyces olivaceus]